MEKSFKLYEMVMVVKMIQPNEQYDGWKLNQRPPQVGDEGYLIEVLRAPNLPDHYLVEKSGPDGVDIWLSEFLAEEIEPA